MFEQFLLFNILSKPKSSLSSVLNTFLTSSHFNYEQVSQGWMYNPQLRLNGWIELKKFYIRGPCLKKSLGFVFGKSIALDTIHDYKVESQMNMCCQCNMWHQVTGTFLRNILVPVIISCVYVCVFVFDVCVFV